jgi:hypothetical protein
MTTAIGDMSKFRYVGGGTWVEVERAPGVPIGAPKLQNYIATYNAATPNTKRDMSADWVTCINPNTRQCFSARAVGILTNDIGAAGPVANGRDQAGAFGANNFIYFFFIMKPDGTVATLSSFSSSNPTLPTGYVAFALADIVRYDATPNLVKTLTRGSKASILMNATPQLNAGVAAAATQITVSAQVPPQALEMKVLAILIVNFTGTVGDCLAYLGVDNTLTATAYWGRYDGSNEVLSKAQRGSAEYTIPGTTLWYLIADVGVTEGAAHGLYVWIAGYTIPNGGE